MLHLVEMYKYGITILLLLLTCKPQPIFKTDSDPRNRTVSNKIKIKGDSNHVEINYYWYLNRIDTIKGRDTL